MLCFLQFNAIEWGQEGGRPGEKRREKRGREAKWREPGEIEEKFATSSYI